MIVGYTIQKKAQNFSYLDLVITNFLEIFSVTLIALLVLHMIED